MAGAAVGEGAELAISFSAVVGQQRMKLALVLAAVEPRVGGVLVRGERGTAKTTLVRALAAVLPPRTVVEGCPFGCRPGQGSLCDSCCDRRAAGEQLPLTTLPTKVVDLPLGASEDRVVGSIDMEEALQTGSRAFLPGLLAAANGQIFYVDEVNLLDHHLVDVLLDAAAMGVNTVEREGISASHPSQFLLVGTMNPEEGELRPQLLDRFGLCVDVRGLLDLDQRVAVMERDAVAVDPGADRALSAQIAAARQLLPRVQVPRAVVGTAAAIALDQMVVGHRADLVMVRAARARRALQAAEEASPSLEVTLQDLLDVAELVLVHRRRSSGGYSLAASSEPGEGAEPSDAPAPAGSDLVPSSDPADAGAESDDPARAGPSDGDGAGVQTETGATTGSGGPGESEPVAVEEALPAATIRLPRERLRHHGAGRRSQTTSKDRRGRYVGSRWVEKTTDLALDATLRAAAPHQLRRRSDPSSGDGRAVQLEKRDLRQKVRERRIGNLIVFLVDASASMDAEQRMDATRSAILALLKDAYVRRDRVAMISFSGRSARVVLRPTGSVDLAERQLTKIAVGGTTPLTHGLVAALDLIGVERMRDSEVLPLLVLISDGRGNISLHGEEPLAEAQMAAAAVRREQIRALVIDSSRDHLQPPAGREGGGPGARFAGYNFNACVDLAERMAAQYFGLFDISEQGILRPVAEALRRPG